VLVPVFGEQHRVVLLVDVEVARRAFLFPALEHRRHLVHALIDLSAVLGPPEIMSGVRASSIRIESTSSTIA